MAKGSFKAAASLGVARGMHTATTLADGRVLAIGGFASAQQGKVAFVEESELYDPLADAWTKVSKVTGKEGLMRSPWGFVTVKRVLHTATTLSDGRVLVTGGYGVEKKALLGGFGPDVVSVLETAHVFDPRTNKFIHVGSMGHPRYGHTATLMADGRVLIAGGYSPGFFSMHSTLAPIEIFDPKTNRFSTPGFILPTSLEEKRQDHAAVALDNGGGVLLIGGQHYTNKWLGLKRELVLSASGEVFSSSKLTSVGNLAKPRRFPAATLLNGQAVVMGGDDMKNVVGDIEMFDRTTGKFQKKGSLEVARTHGAAASSGDYALLIGGFAPSKGEVDTVEAFDGTKTLPGLKLASKRNSAAVASLKDGRVLVTGGFVGGAKDLRSMDGRVISSCEVYSGK